MEKSNLNRRLIMVKGAKLSKDVSSCHILSQASDSSSSEKFQTFRFVSFGFGTLDSPWQRQPPTLVDLTPEVPCNPQRLQKYTAGQLGSMEHDHDQRTKFL